MTLKIGDRVRLTDNPHHKNAHPLLRNGQVYQVSRLYGTGRCVELEGYGPPVSVGRLEKIKPEPKFRAGDRVQSLLHDNERVIVTVTDPRHGTWNYVRARFDDGTYGLWRESELELATEPPRPLGLQAGDKVVNLKTGREGLVLKGPISGELKVYDQKPPIKDAVPAAALEEYEFHYPGTYDVWRRVTEKKKAQPW